MADARLSILLDLTSGEPTPHGSLQTRARETGAATEVLKLDWRDNLGLANRSLEPTLAARRARVRAVNFFSPSCCACVQMLGTPQIRQWCATPRFDSKARNSSSVRYITS